MDCFWGARGTKLPLTTQTHWQPTNPIVQSPCTQSKTQSNSFLQYNEWMNSFCVGWMNWIILPMNDAKPTMHGSCYCNIMHGNPTSAMPWDAMGWCPVIHGSCPGCLAGCDENTPPPAAFHERHKRATSLVNYFRKLLKWYLNILLFSRYSLLNYLETWIFCTTARAKVVASSAEEGNNATQRQCLRSIIRHSVPVKVVAAARNGICVLVLKVWTKF